MSEMESRGIRPDVGLYNWAIKAASVPRTGAAMRAILTREGRWRAPEQASKGSRSGSGAGRSKSPSYGWEAATGLLREMSAGGVAPNSITYTLVISACQKDREPERALAVLREMQELAAPEATATGTEPPPAEATAEKEEGEDEDRGQTAADGVAAAIEGADSGGVGSGESGAGGAGGAGGEAAGASSSTSSSSASSSSSSSRRRRRGVAPNVFHYSTVMSAFAEQPGGWQRILALIREMEVCR